MRGLYRTGLIAIGGFLIGGLLLSGCGKPQGPPQGGATEVAVEVMKQEQVPVFTELPGRTSAFLVAEVRPQVSGIIKQRLFTEGADVKAGQVLYQIDPATYQAAYDNAAAVLAKAEAQLQTIRLRAGRYKELVAIKAVSQQEYDDVTANLSQAEADVKYAKASVETARINLGYTRITAPITGRTGKSNVTVGALVTANQPASLTVIQQLDPIYVDATRSSAHLLEMKRHMESGIVKGGKPDQARVKLTLEDGTAYPMEGSLKFSDVTVDPSTGSFIIRMVFPNKKQTLLPGMYVRAVIQEGVAERAILVPQQAVSRDPKGNPVALVVDADSKVEMRMITVDRAIGDKWVASSGLKPGDRVIVEGLQRVRPGVPVKIVPPGASQKDAPAGTKTEQAPAKTTPSSAKTEQTPAKTEQSPAKAK